MQVERKEYFQGFLSRNLFSTIVQHVIYFGEA